MRIMLKNRFICVQLGAALLLLCAVSVAPRSGTVGLAPAQVAMDQVQCEAETLRRLTECIDRFEAIQKRRPRSLSG
jgi:hypothetical protein